MTEDGVHGLVPERLNNMEQYKTKELSEIVAYVCSGLPVDDTVPGTPGYAYFNKTVALEEMKKKFWAGELRVDPIDYELKRKMMLNKLML